MPTGRAPTVVISAPTANAVVGFIPFFVAGQVTAEGYPDPVEIDSVTVQLDAGPVIAASLKRLPNKNLTEIAFQASIQVVGGQDPHIVTVVATTDGGASESKTVEVIAGTLAASPAFLIDVVTLPFPTPVLDPSGPVMQKLVSDIQKRLTIFAPTLASINKIFIGPNLLSVPIGQNSFVLRIGLWIEDYNFPVAELIQPSPPDFPLPRLSPDAATAGFGLAELLSLPASFSGNDGAFAFSVPLTTFQQILDSIKPQLTAEAATHDYSLDSVTVEIDPSGQTDQSGGTLTTTFNGSLPLDVPLTASVTETLGWKAGTGVDAALHFPAVVNTSTSVGVASALDWFLGAFLPGVIELLLSLLIGISNVVAGIGSKVGGMVGGLLAELPARIPFPNTVLPDFLQQGYDFPTIVFDWTTFSPANNLSIGGSCLLGIENRDQSMVQVTVSGPGDLIGYGYGDDVPYQVTLNNIYPDVGGLTWQTSGLGLVLTGSILTDLITQIGSFTVEFPLPPKIAPGKYPFVLTVNARETCATIPGNTLTGSGSLAVFVEIPKIPH